MGFFNLFGSSSNNINELVEQARTTREALIIDVRTPTEFSQGHIENAINIPLDSIQEIANKISDRTTPLYLYCASGARSSNACRFLESQGFEQVTNMGGIASWRGPVIKGR